jgi:hypothetical protein
MDDRALAQRRKRAISAATDAGRALGVIIEEPLLLHEGFSIVAHLAPSPVVVRVPTVLPVGITLEAHSAQQQRELDLAEWLGGAGLPVVRPSPIVPRKPVVRDGFSMTFWERVEVDRDVPPDFIANAAHVAELHGALASCPVALPFLWPMTAIEPAIEHLRKHPGLAAPGDLDKVEREWSQVGPMLSSRAAFEARFPHVAVQPIHGDAPCYNLIATTSGPRHADFEHACLGPPEWDLAGFGPAIQGAYDAAATARGLRKLDPTCCA